MPAGEEPIHLQLEDALELYAAIINGTPAEAADHLRNRNGLEGALARPATYAHSQQADPALQAAVLAHGIAEGHLRRRQQAARARRDADLPRDQRLPR